MSAHPDAEFVAVGRIGPPRGVRGDVFVEPWTDDPAERFAAGSTLRTEPAAAGPLTVESANFGGSKLVIHFTGVEDRTTAAALHGIRLMVVASARPPIEDPDEFYASDLVGLVARTADGTQFGPVRDVLNLAGAEYLVLDVGGREQLVPFVGAIVPTVDLARGLVVIDPPDGLFDQ
ncbi:MAG: ribosome maturation factor RimM [Actinomycetota bacterium]|nr:ribosome maturation factor RimM [Actinomycetota bacterium]